MVNSQECLAGMTAAFLHGQQASEILETIYVTRVLREKLSQTDTNPQK